MPLLEDPVGEIERVLSDCSVMDGEMGMRVGFREGLGEGNWSRKMELISRQGVAEPGQPARTGSA